MRHASITRAVFGSIILLELSVQSAFAQHPKGIVLCPAHCAKSDEACQDRCVPRGRVARGHGRRRARTQLRAAWRRRYPAGRPFPFAPGEARHEGLWPSQRREATVREGSSSCARVAQRPRFGSSPIHASATARSMRGYDASGNLATVAIRVPIASMPIALRRLRPLSTAGMLKKFKAPASKPASRGAARGGGRARSRSSPCRPRTTVARAQPASRCGR